MKIMLCNEARTVGVCEIEPADDYQEFFQVDITLLKEAMKMVQPFAPKVYGIGVLQAPTGLVALCLTPIDQPTTAIMIAEINEEPEGRKIAEDQSTMEVFEGAATPPSSNNSGEVYITASLTGPTCTISTSSPQCSVHHQTSSGC